MRSVAISSTMARSLSPAASGIMLLGPAAHDTRAATDRELADPARATDLLLWRAIQRNLP
jgi:hypothetical protein